MTDYKWPKGFDPCSLNGETLLLPLCIDPQKHNSEKLAGIIELLNKTAAEGIKFKVQIVRVDTLFRHNARFILECNAAAMGLSYETVTELQVNKLTQDVTANWSNQTLEVLRQLNPSLLTESTLEKSIQDWNYWTKGKYQQLYEGYNKDLETAPQSDLVLRELMVGDNKIKHKFFKSNITVATNSPRYNELSEKLRQSINLYTLEENAVFRVWADVPFKFLLSEYDIPSSMSRINTNYNKNQIKIIKPRLTSLELKPAEQHLLPTNTVSHASGISAPPTSSTPKMPQGDAIHIPNATTYQKILISTTNGVLQPKTGNTSHQSIAGDLTATNSPHDADNSIKRTQQLQSRPPFLAFFSYPPDSHMHVFFSAAFSVAVDKVVEAQSLVNEGKARPEYAAQVTAASTVLLREISKPSSSAVPIPPIYTRHPSPTRASEPKSSADTSSSSTRASEPRSSADTSSSPSRANADLTTPVEYNFDLEQYKAALP